jgi:integrase
MCLEKLRGHLFRPVVVVALGTGLRRGELLALQWGSVDLEGRSIRVERSLEETKSGLRFKAPKSKQGRRSVSLPSSVVEVLRSHRRQQQELWLALGLGKLSDDALVFCQPDGLPMSPDKLSRDWHRLVIARKLPKVSFHALRHRHVSALIDGGLDVFSVSRRIGHASAALTLRTYTHLFSKKDAVADAAIDAALRTVADPGV